MKNLALSLLIAGSLVMPVAYAADSDMKADSAQTTETKTTDTMENSDGNGKKNHARKHHRGNRGDRHHKKHGKRHHGGKHHRHHAGEGCDNGGCGTGQCH